MQSDNTPPDQNPPNGADCEENGQPNTTGSEAGQGPFEELNADPNAHQPIFNLPTVIVLLAGLLVAVQLVRVYALSADMDELLLYFLAFIPASYGPLAAGAPFPNSGYWSPFTYGLLHGDWLHLAMNILWMTAFGAPVAKRFGVWRFLVLTLLTSAGGALLHYATFANAFVPVIGASGSVSGYMGAAARFAFNNRSGRGFSAEGPALGLFESFKNKQFLIFFTVWMAMNFLFGSGIVQIAGAENEIAWQAHIGGFLTGIFLFSLLDPRKHRRHT